MKRNNLDSKERMVFLMTLKKLLEQIYKEKWRDIDSVTREKYPREYEERDIFLAAPIFRKELIDKYFNLANKSENLKYTHSTDIIHYFYTYGVTENKTMQERIINDSFFYYEVCCASEEFLKYQDFTVNDLLFNESGLLKKEMKKLADQSGLNFKISTKNLKLFFYLIWKLNNNINYKENSRFTKDAMYYYFKDFGDSFKKAKLFFADQPFMVEFIDIFFKDFFMGVNIEDSRYMYLFEEEILKIFLSDLNFENLIHKGCDLFKSSALAIDPTFRKLLIE